MDTIIYVDNNQDLYDFQQDYVLKRLKRFVEQLPQDKYRLVGLLNKHGNSFNYAPLTNKPLTTKEERFIITHKPLSLNDFTHISQIVNSENPFLFGCLVDFEEIGNKTILQEPIDSQTPEWFNPLNTQLKEFSIPGYSCFSLKSFTKAFWKMKERFPRDSYRVKLGNAYNGLDQFEIYSELDFYDVYEKLKEHRNLDKHGLVIEVNLIQTKAFGLTKFRLPHLSHSVNTYGVQSFNQEKYYTGTKLLANSRTDDLDTLNDLYKIYQKFCPQLNRFNIDIIEGYNASGETIRGVIDISLRTGAATTLELNLEHDSNYDAIHQIYLSRTPNRELIQNIINNTENNKDPIKIEILGDQVACFSYASRSENINARLNKVTEEITMLSESC